MAEAWEQEQAMQAASDQAHAQKDDGLIRLVSPKIELTSFVVEGTNHKALLLGPGHMTKTAEPGQAGNAVITGHRDTFFRHIYELDKGDDLFIERGGKRFVYKVTGKKVVDPTDLSVTHPTSDAQVTLITCYPIYFIGPAPKRLVVFSKLMNEQDAALTASDGKSTPATHVEAVGIGAAAAAASH
jgi:LPXTG-site transpeptidase (sortase) family protein